MFPKIKTLLVASGLVAMASSCKKTSEISNTNKASSQNQNKQLFGDCAPFQWAKQLGNPAYEEDMRVDDAGNTYLLSYYNKISTLTKYDTKGNTVWSTNVTDVALGKIRFDAQGNVYGQGTVEVGNEYDFRIDYYNVKFNSTGTVAFKEKLASVDDFGFGLYMDKSIAVDAGGSIYNVGYTNNYPVDINPGTGVYNINARGYVVQKLDPNGNFVAGKLIPFQYQPENINIMVGNDGSIYLEGTVDENTPNHVTYVGVEKYDKYGNLLWTSALPNGTYLLAQSGEYTDIDGAGNIYVYTQQQLIKFNGSNGAITSHSVNATGLHVSNMSVDKNGNSYFTGYVIGDGNYGSSPDFDPGPGVTTLPRGAGQDVFVDRFDTNGNFTGAAVFKSSLQNQASNGDSGDIVAADNSGNVYLTGHFVGSLDADPTASQFLLTPVAPNTTDVFLIKVTPCQ